MICSFADHSRSFYLPTSVSLPLPLSGWPSSRASIPLIGLSLSVSCTSFFLAQFSLYSFIIWYKAYVMCQMDFQHLCLSVFTLTHISDAGCWYHFDFMPEPQIISFQSLKGNKYISKTICVLGVRTFVNVHPDKCFLWQRSWTNCMIKWVQIAFTFSEDTSVVKQGWAMI